MGKNWSLLFGREQLIFHVSPSSTPLCFLTTQQSLCWCAGFFFFFWIFCFSCDSVLSERESCDHAVRFANNCLIPPSSTPAVLLCVIFTPSSSRESSTAAGKAAGCVFNPSSKCSLHLTALQSWISPQRTEDVCCAGRGMLGTNPDRRREVTMSIHGVRLRVHGSRAGVGYKEKQIPSHIPLVH